MAELEPEFEQRLSELSDEDWRALTSRVRPPADPYADGIRKGAELYDRNHGRRIQVEGTEHTTTGKWS